METHPILFWSLLIISFAVSTKISINLLRRPGQIWGKVILVCIAVIPFFGPIFFAFIDAPPILPESEKGKQIPKGTEIYPSFDPLVDGVKNIIDNKKNREFK